MTEIYKYRNYIYNHLRYRINNEVVAEELTDGVMDKAVRLSGTFDSEKSALKTWLTTIANTTLIDYTRTRKPITSISSYTDDNGKESFELVAEETTDNSELKAKLTKAFNSLKPKYKRIAILYFKNEMSYQEIATVCDVPMGTVKGMISRCREMLKAELQTVSTM